MTIADNYLPLKQIGNGVTTQFSGTWPMLNASYAQVFLQDAITGVQTPVTQGAGAGQYQISLTSTGFTVTFGTAPAASQYAVIGRSTIRNQLTPYTTSAGFQGANEEFSFDKLTAIHQEIANTLGRTITAPLADTSTMTLPTLTARANRVLCFDNSGNVTVSDQTLATIESSGASAAAAAASATAAASSATSASGYATAASGSATSASTSATNAANSAAAAAGYAGSFAGCVQYNANTTLTSTDVGKRIISGGGGPSVLTLPLTSAVSNGAALWVNAQNGQTSFAVQGSDLMYVYDGGAATGISTYALQYFAEILVFKYAANIWIVIPRRAAAKVGVQTYASGSGTYTVPVGVLYLRVRAVGGGGGGGGSSSAANGGTGGTGGNTTFGTSLLTANGGAGGQGTSNDNGGTGGTASLGTGPIGLALQGGNGGAGGLSGAGGTATSGGMGSASPFGGAGGNAPVFGGGVNGADAIANTGSGAAGGGAPGPGTSGGGGGAGGFVDAIINTPAASYAYAVGAGGTAGSSGTGGRAGGTGGSGYIIIEEHYIY